MSGDRPGWVHLSESPEETTRLGSLLGALLEPGMFVGLIGELGAGKTRLVRGIAEGAGVDVGQVASPTFAIVHPYAGRGFTLQHADLYRLGDLEELYATGFFDLLEGPDAMVVEWLDRIPGAAPAERLEVHLSQVDDERRRLEAFAWGERHARLLERWRQARA